MANHPEGQHHPDKQVTVDDQKPAQPFLPKGKENGPQGQGEFIPVKGEREGFHKTQTADLPGMLLSQTEAQRTAPIVQNQGDVGECQRGNEVFQVPVMGEKTVIQVGLVTFAETDQVQGNTAVFATQGFDDIAPQITGCGVTMDEKKQRPFAFIDVMQAMPIQRDVT